jgi:phage shock protein PspC (stress-responsive transcriptional regulator)
MTDEEKDQDSGHVWPEPGEEETREVPPTEPATEPMSDAHRPRRLLRSNDDRVIAGVAGGLGRYFDIDPVIVRIGFAVTLFFGGLGVLAYLAAALFVPADDGTGSPAPHSRGRSAARVAGFGLLAIVAFGAFGTLTAAAAFATGIGYGLAVVAVIVVIGIALVVASFRGGARWLIVPALALTIGVGVAAAADLDLEGGVGERDYRPASAAAIPAGGYELGVGRLAVDLRDIDWSPKRVLDLHVRVGAGQAVVAVPSDVCVVAHAHAGAGDLRIAGEESDGTDVNADVAAGSTATPRLVLDADVDLGQIRVINDDTADVTQDGRFSRFDSGDDAGARAANARACAG